MTDRGSHYAGGHLDGKAVGSEQAAIEPAGRPPALPVRPAPVPSLANGIRGRNRTPIPPHTLARVKAALERLPPAALGPHATDSHHHGRAGDVG